jgi:hypothetical protein
MSLRGTNKKQNMTNIINQILLKLLIKYLNYRFSSKFNEIKNKINLVDDGVNLTVLFNHIFKLYQSELQNKGVLGAYRLRKYVLSQINDLNINMFYKKDEVISDDKLKDSLKHLYIFKDILRNIKYSIEALATIKTIISFMINVASIPLIAVSFYLLLRKLFIAASVIIAGFFSTGVITEKYKDKVDTIMETLREYSIRFHNWLFSDHLISAPNCGLPSGARSEGGFRLPIFTDPQPVEPSTSS